MSRNRARSWFSRMKFLPIALGTVLPLATTPAHATPEVAMITDLKGSCEIHRAERTLPCEIFATLLAGDEVRTETQSRLALTYFTPAREYTIDGKALARVDDDGLRTRDGVASRRDLAGIVSGPEVRNWRQDLDITGGMVMRDVPGGMVLRMIEPHRVRLQAPVGTVLHQPAEFRWDYTGNPRDRLAFFLQDDSGRITLETTVSGLSLRLPPGIVLKDGSTYRWGVAPAGEIGAPQANRAGDAESASFAIADAAMRKRAEQLRPPEGAPFTDRVLYAVALENLGLLEEARAWWARLAAERPGSEKLRALARGEVR